MRRQQKLPYNRQTPPFVEFQTVRQCLRISLPEEHMQDFMGLRDMENINNTQRNHMGYQDVLDYCGRPDPSTSHLKKKKNKNRNKNRNKQKQDNCKKYVQDDRLNSQFTDRKHKPKCKSKTKPIPQPIRSKPKVGQKSIFQDIKYPENKVKPRQFLNLNNFSQCLYPKTQNFEQIYKIHSQRIKNNHSNNLQQHRQKIQTHRRGQSELYQQITAKPLKSIHTNNAKNSKTITYKQGTRQLISKSTRLRNNLVQEICNNSLDSISEYRIRTNFTDEEGIVVNMRNKNVIEELYSSSEEVEAEQGSLDSEDEYLLTMVSQDLRSIRNNIPLIPYPQKEDTKKEEKNQTKNKPNNFLTIPRLQFENIKSEQIQIVHSEQEDPKSSARLQNKIDTILQQIQYLKTIQQYQPKKNPQQQEYLQEKSSQSSKFSNDLKTKQIISWNNSQPSLFELQIILHNCLTLDENELQSGRVKPVPIKEKEASKPITGIKMKKDKDLSSRPSRSVDTDDKWKQNKIQRIKKAQRLLKQGYLQANKILGSSLNHDKETHQLDIHLKKYTQKRLATNSHSMSHLQKIHPKSHHRNLAEQYKEKGKQAKMEQLKKQLEHSPLLNNKLEQQHLSDGSSIIDVISAKDKDFVAANPFVRLKNKGEEVQQIIQIIIIDLCIEVIEEVQIGFVNPTDMFEKLFTTLTKSKAKKRIGFNSGALEVFTFLQKFGKFLQSQKNNKGQTYKTIIRNRIQQPIGPKPLQLLKFMREPADKNDETLSQQSQSAFQQKETFALSLSWFHQFSQQYIKQYNFGTYYNYDEQRQLKRKLFLRNAMHVHNKAIFDSINETIDKYRPYGILGQPFPWKRYNKPAPISVLKFNKILNDTFEQVCLYCRFLCGIFIEQHISYKLNQFEYLEFKQDRLNKLLCQHINENEIRWTFIEDEETEMMVEMGRFVTAYLLNEVVGEIMSIEDNHRRLDFQLESGKNQNAPSLE